MSALLAIGSVALIGWILNDGFEAIVLPRGVTRRYRFTRFFYTNSWAFWRAVALRIPAPKVREAFLSRFGPLSLLALFATWAMGLIVGFASLHWSLGTSMIAPERAPGYTTYLYWSGVTFFTLGYGEITPVAPLGRFLAVCEAGIGFGFLAVIIGYLPVLYQACSRREVTISLMDARAGSPPSATQVLLRLGRSCNIAQINPLLGEWERWAAELLESHLSFGVLSFYRSQHDNQSWLAAITTMLDTCAILMVAVKGHDPYQAQLTFAMGRHAVVDISLILKTPPQPPAEERLSLDQLHRLREILEQAGLDLSEGPDIAQKLAELRGMYEPFANGLAGLLLLKLPEIVDTGTADNWQRSAWMPRTPGIGSLPGAKHRR
jgi:hypothetical protein